MPNLEKSESITSVFTEYKYSLRKMVSRYLSRKSDIEDVLQETFARTFAADKKKSVESPKLYLFKTAKHLVFNENTKVTNMLTEYLEDAVQIDYADSTESPLDTLSNDEERALLQQAIDSLPAQCKRVTSLRLNYDFAVKEIAEELHLSLSTVEKHLAKGIERCDSYMREFVSESKSIRSEDEMPIKKKGVFLMPEIVNFPNALTQIREQASQWIAKMQAGSLSDDEQAQLKAWVKQSKTHEIELTKMAKNWDYLQTLGKKHGAVYSDAPNNEGITRTRKPWKHYALKMAAVISFFALFPLMYFLSVQPNATTEFNTNGLFVTKVGAQKTIHLSDGSVVFLNTNSKLLVNYNKDARNLTLMKGEASFDVAKDKLHPFVVKAGNGDVQALGTSFAVRLNGEKVDVLVAHGTVRVRANENIANTDTLPVEQQEASTPEQSVIATAGNRVVFEKSKVESVTVEAQETLDRELYWKKGFLDFNQIPLAQVVSEVARYTDYKIIISDSTLEHLTVGGYYPIDNIETIFETLEMNFNLEVTELENNTFLIKKSYKS